jgi:heme/copper-type cytochrome/quinol oxidase subunit 4
MNKIPEILPFLIPLIVIQFGFQIYCIVNLIKRKKVRFNNKFLWGVIIICFQLLGAGSYLLFRGEDE